MTSNRGKMKKEGIRWAVPLFYSKVACDISIIVNCFEISNTYIEILFDNSGAFLRELASTSLVSAAYPFLMCEKKLHDLHHHPVFRP